MKTVIEVLVIICPLLYPVMDQQHFISAEWGIGRFRHDTAAYLGVQNACSRIAGCCQVFGYYRAVSHRAVKADLIVAIICTQVTTTVYSTIRLQNGLYITFETYRSRHLICAVSAGKHSHSKK